MSTCLSGNGAHAIAKHSLSLSIYDTVLSTSVRREKKKKRSNWIDKVRNCSGHATELHQEEEGESTSSWKVNEIFLSLVSWNISYGWRNENLLANSNVFGVLSQWLIFLFVRYIYSLKKEGKNVYNTFKNDVRNKVMKEMM